LQVALPLHDPQLPPQPSSPHCFPLQSGEQVAHWPVPLHVVPPVHEPQLPPQPSLPHCFPLQPGVQAPH